MTLSLSIYVAFGAVSAAVIAGFFSFVNLISAKENKVSEFRQSWIDGLRMEVSQFAAAIHDLARLKSVEKNNDLTTKEYHELAAEPYKIARESLAAIQLRLNPEHIKDKPDGLEAALMNAVRNAREKFNKGDYAVVVDACNTVRDAAAPLLKFEWERVKLGEPGYRRIRTAAWIIVSIGIVFVVVGSIWLTVISFAA